MSSSIEFGGHIRPNNFILGTNNLQYPQENNVDQENPHNPENQNRGLINDKQFELEERVGFIRKVYGILFTQLGFTFTLCLYCKIRFCLTIILASYDPYFGAVVRHPASMILAIIGLIGSLCAMLVFQMTRKVPQNYIMLGLFTFSQTILVASITAYLTPRSVVLSILAFGFITFMLYLGALQIKSFENFLASSFLMLFVALILEILSIVFFFSDYSQPMMLLYSAAGIIIYGTYVIIDMYLIAKRLDVEDYILGALTLYVDLMSLFIHILRILGSKK
ncbi:UNKNOWN [Stylonychia lemnae]|uniref:Uncharacterized protein n=1 Tax=Stylonychia lemnae TaxID=5949 RepID=A0A078BEP7_STYLE|nr:UNKNOWN [Stylonychia lemnae]|eukprot:CDW91632.1 UNKNOWN [Stylonychia lemnae]